MTSLPQSANTSTLTSQKQSHFDSLSKDEGCSTGSKAAHKTRPALRADDKKSGAARERTHNLRHLSSLALAWHGKTDRLRAAHKTVMFNCSKENSEYINPRSYYSFPMKAVVVAIRGKLHDHKEKMFCALLTKIQPKLLVENLPSD
ncbi:hypothetical protein Anapl_06215 [Anas platyrhynchos]|uniref:Uncharacterized protein n=1 Tax=Anas platyrhynchos TaxID=8839 RepID=R0LI99_ANAPL|nr:hypothetical protein Anapl_06215 [Anas platyrhynchos]